MCLTNHNTMKTYERVEVGSTLFLTLALERSEWSSSCPTHFTPGERAPRTHWL